MRSSKALDLATQTLQHRLTVFRYYNPQLYEIVVNNIIDTFFYHSILFVDTLKLNSHITLNLNNFIVKARQLSLQTLTKLGDVIASLHNLFFGSFKHWEKIFHFLIELFLLIWYLFDNKFIDLLPAFPNDLRYLFIKLTLFL